MLIRRWCILALTALLCCDTRPASAAFTYRADFNATWSAQTHPNAYPTNAHFSALVGGVHNNQVEFWAPGGIASVGIERMAELGATTQLRDEVQSAINAGTASSVILGSGVTSPGSTSVNFDVLPAFPLVTLVTMVAPSPDWFVGVHGLDLRDGQGWKRQVTVDLFTYDAGTDNGVNFTSADIDAVPRQPIALLGAPFAASDPRLGTFTFTLLYDGRAQGDYNFDGAVDAADYTTWRDSLGQFGDDLNADGNHDGKIDGLDYNVWKSALSPGATAGGGSLAARLVAPAVPEPSAAWLAAGVAAFVPGWRHRFQRRSSARSKPSCPMRA